MLIRPYSLSTTSCDPLTSLFRDTASHTGGSFFNPIVSLYYCAYECLCLPMFAYLCLYYNRIFCVIQEFFLPSCISSNGWSCHWGDSSRIASWCLGWIRCKWPSYTVCDCHSCCFSFPCIPTRSIDCLLYTSDAADE